MTNSKERSPASDKTDTFYDKTIIRLIGKPKVYFWAHIYQSLDPV